MTERRPPPKGRPTGGGQPRPGGPRQSGRPRGGGGKPPGPRPPGSQERPPGPRPEGSPRPKSYDPLDVATPTGANTAESSQLLFMSHAPGAGKLAPRVETDVDESLAGKVLGRLAARVDGKRGDQRDGRGTAGVSALRRAMAANSRGAQGRSKRKAPSVDETLEGASKHVGGEAPPVVVVGEAAPVRDPSFLSLMPGAFATPLRGWLVTLLHTLMIALAMFLLELSPPLGLAACLLATIELLGFRTRLVQDACAGRAKVRWPEASELGATLLIAFVASLWCLLPAVGFGLASWGKPAFYTGGSTSLVMRAQRLVNPKPAVAVEGAAFGHHTLLELEALSAPEFGTAERTSAEVTRDLQTGVGQTFRAVIDLDRASPLGLVARILLLAGFLVYPMTILCAIRLRSVYAAVYPPIVIRSALTAPGAYLIVLILTLTYAAGALAGAFLGLPALHAALGSGPGHLVWILLQAGYLVIGHMVLAGLLGRVYLSHKLAFGWD